MRDNLNLDDLREYLEHEKQRKASLDQSFKRTQVPALIVFVLSGILSIKFWLVSLVVFKIVILTALCSIICYSILYNTPQQLRARRVVRLVLSSDQVLYIPLLTVRLVIEFTVFLLFASIGVLSLRSYLAQGTPITPANILADLAVAPQQAVPFVVGWGIKAGIVVAWILRFGRNWLRLSDWDRRKLPATLFSYFNADQYISITILIIFLFDIFPILSSFLVNIFVMAIIFVFFSGRVLRQVEWRIFLRYVHPHFQVGEYDVALKKNNQLLRLAPKSAYWLHSRAAIVFYSGDYERAEQLWIQRLIAVQNDYPQAIGFALTMLSLVMRRKKRYEDALRYAEYAVDAYPAGATGYGQLVGVYVEREVEAERACKYYDFARSLMTKFSPLDDSGFAVVMAHYGEFATAEAILRGIDTNQLASAGDKARFVYDRAQITRFQGDLAKAREYCEQAIQLDPNGDAGNQAREMLQKLDD